jgi:hypothetical protein
VACPSAGQQDKPQAPDQQSIDRWIAELDSGRYEVREQATRHLVRHGQQALDELSAAADSARPEAAARAVAILEELTASDEGQLKLQALERLAGLEHRREVSRRAGERLSGAWAEISLPIVLELGGRLDDETGTQYVDEQTGQLRSRKFILGREWSGGDEGLVHVARLDFVSTLSLRRAPITAEGLEQLAKMPALRSLELFGLGFDEAQMKTIQAALPHVTLDVRSGAMLGVHGLITAPNAQVDRVVPGSAADKAGLASGDVIVKVDDTEVATFTELTAEIAEQEPGSTVVLTIRRDDRLIERDVTFGHWE